MFDEFDLNAAADGLFHPASTIEAFTEHDAKYRQEIQQPSEKPHSGPRRVRSGSEYPPSRENHRLPALHSGKTKRDRLSARPKAKIHSSANSGSAPASMATASSLSKLLTPDGGKCGLSTTHSDSNLYAPRRQDTVPSSADRNALDFYERELDGDNNNPHRSPVVNASPTIGELGNNEVVDSGSSVVPPLDFSLARKFEELKRIMKSNREKHNSARQDSEQLSNEVRSKEPPPAHSASATVVADAKSSSRCNSSGRRSAIRATSSGSSVVGETASQLKMNSKKRSTPSARATTDMNTGSSGTKRTLAHHAPEAANRIVSSTVAVVKAPSRPNKDTKVRSGVSLSDLKAEHREALQMLKELGGPLDPDYLLTDVDLISTKGNRVGRSNSRMTGMSRPSKSTLSLARETSHKNISNQVQSRGPTPPTSANYGVSMVTKLRESISSGRGPSRESSPRTSSPNEKASSPISSDCKDVSNRGNEKTPAHSNQTHTGNSTANIDKARAVEANDSTDAGKSESLPPPLTPNTNTSDPWNKYEDDIVDDEDEDNEVEHDASTEVKGALTSGDRYSDEDFESDW
ncbi:unnamed protein product [Phytophthora lilii]|uniref:Unnamed protein product n=1 Tax=Phytophthora lilii TaxID=2077276 RepID=A0A9W6TPA7_9STRA|nr:unnamed protein product [Phytophthora lilii]